MATDSSERTPPASVSAYQRNKIIDAFASGESALAAASGTRLPYHTVRRLYELIRRRLIEIGYISSLEKHLSQAFADDEEDRLDRRIAALQPALKKRRGVTERTRDEHIAELLYRQEEAWRVPANVSPPDRSRDIRYILRMSGPLDRPLSPFLKRKVSLFLLQRQLDTAMADIEAAYAAGLDAFARDTANTLPPRFRPAIRAAVKDQMAKSISSFRQRMRSLRSSRRDSGS
ncbi:hypothetical protein [Prosthecomicrobium pneumaticum]|uniref:Uncharacterized protein n=1 Tax=Prosthecomicrobium pneumaticum TaxID=81895 RepID=A0A7W9FN65_9HYPH|nr:hypothetical protein [Prosthecomicrobium pneumaticum]MBB5753792.1 hypothetical protein [Prosthecomicrobium pneumaticum]